VSSPPRIGSGVTPLGSRGLYISYTLFRMDRVEADPMTNPRTHCYIPSMCYYAYVGMCPPKPLSGGTGTGDHTTKDSCATKLTGCPPRWNGDQSTVK